MAIIDGGVTGRPSGKLGGLIFGAARTRDGKAVTVREAVDPSNPRSPEQQQQRGKFSQALNITKALGPTIYQEDWNRAVGQLPGFQGLMSIFLDQIDDNDDLQPPDDVPLGDLHFPDTLDVTDPGDRTIEADYSAEQGPNGTASDEVILAGIEQSKPQDRERDVVATVADSARGGSPASTPKVDEVAEPYVWLFYLRGAGGAEGLLTRAAWGTVDISV